MRRSILTAVLVTMATSAMVSAQPADVAGNVVQKTEPPAPEKTEAPPPAPDEIPAVTAPVMDAPNAEAAASAAKVVAVPAAPAPPPVVERRSRYKAAVIQALDKVTAESMRFEVAVGQPVRYGDLIFTVSACETTSPGEIQRDAIAYLDVVSRPKAAPGRTPPTEKSVFKGWSFAASPSVNPFQHSVYDAWLVACKYPI